MGWLLDLDRRLYLTLHGRARHRWIDPVMIWFTKAGTMGILWLGIAFGMLIDGTSHARFVAAAAVAALLLAEGSINLVLKPLVARERPYFTQKSSLLVGPPGAHSWPSAHAGSSVAAGIVLTIAYLPWGLLFSVIALIIAYSRIYVGVHYPLDVAAGIIIGTVVALAVIVVVAALPFSLS